MQQQVIKRNMSSEFGWGNCAEGLGQHNTSLGSGSWTSTANMESTNSPSSSWQTMGKSDSASDAGDDNSSVKSGSTVTSVTNMVPLSQDSTSTNNNSGTLQQTSSSSPWNSSNQSMASIDSSPWSNTSSAAASSMGSLGWATNPSSLSLSTNSQGHNNIQSGSSILGANSVFNSTSSPSSVVWPTSLTGNNLGNTPTPPSNMSSGLQGNSISSQWQNNSVLGNIGDFSKPSDSAWNNSVSSLIDNGKDLVASNTDQRLWGISSDKTGDSQWEVSKNQWGSNGLNNDHSTSSSELSFAQATLKGLKLPPSSGVSQTPVNSRQEEILRAIESHEGWGSRPIRQDTSWDVETSPKSHRKFSSEGTNGASNVWNNHNGTAIWEAVRENQSGSWNGGTATNNSWNADKDQHNWAGPTRPPPQETNNWNVPSTPDPKTFGTWGAPNVAGDASNKMWGQKTEIGSWNDSGPQQRSMSSWGDDGDAGAWEEQRRLPSTIGGMQNMVPPSPGHIGPAGMSSMVTQGMSSMNTQAMSGMVTQGMSGMVNQGMSSIVNQGMPSMNSTMLGSEATPWNDGQKPNWNPGTTPSVVSRPSLDEPWNKPPPTRSGWGDPAQDGLEVDNGTSVWASSVPKQPPAPPKTPAWNEPPSQSQWNATVGTKPKVPGWDETSWAMAQRAKSERFPEEVPTNSVEVGYWNGLPQDNNSWTDSAAFRGVRKITGQQLPQKFVSGNSNPPTQMRAKLLQQLMDMGFRKEEAQNALITNNLNLELAINDLKSGNINMSRKDLDMDVFQVNGSQSRMPYLNKGGLGGEDLSEVRPDQVPIFNSLQNTPFSNAQMPNQSFMQNNTSLPPSSLNPNNASINPNMQQKLMQKLQHQAPPSLAPRGQIAPVGSNTSSTNQVPQQQQQLILSQLRQAVHNGFISPQLLNYQLPHNILVLLQNLLQLQTAQQNFVSKQQQMIQQARATGNRNNPQLDQLNGVIMNINQQINSVQKQLQHAQSNLFNSQKMPNLGSISGPVASQSGSSMVDSLDALSTDLANVALQNQSRLTTQWKPSVDITTSMATDILINSSATAMTSVKLSDETGDKTVQGVKSILQNSSPNLNLISGGLGMTGDRTWSSNISSTATSNWPLSSHESTITNSQADNKASSNSSSAANSILAGLPSGLTDVIPEFVPGKPWQGLTKNVEDDPHITPGSIQMQRQLSVNRVHDESLNHLDGHKQGGSSWSSVKPENSLGLSQLGTRPPPNMSSMVNKAASGQQWSSAGNFNRQTSWPHSANSAFTKVTGSGWNETPAGNVSSWILLKNLTVDPNTISALCAQHGKLINFYPLGQGQNALVQYSSRDLAFIAQQRLNNFQMGNSIITAEFIGEADAQRFTAQIPPPPQPSALPPMNTSPWSQAPPSFQSTNARSGDPWSNSTLSQHSSKFGSTGDNLWGLWDRSDHNFNPLSNILGGESI